jgi:hypothetical protein
MIILKFYFSFMTLLISCKDTSKNGVVIIGRADDEKDGAIVVANNGKKVYYLDGVDSWPAKIYGKMVKVTGEKILIEELKEIPRKPGQPFPQQAIGIKKTILKPKWELVK